MSGLPGVAAIDRASERRDHRLVLSSTRIWYWSVPESEGDSVATVSRSKRRGEDGDETAARARILEAAFAAFTRHGYAAASTLEIATRARVSKRELYTLVGNKQEMLIACISERATRLQVRADLPELRDRKTLETVLSSAGAQLVREVSDPTSLRYSGWRSAKRSAPPKWRRHWIPSDARQAAPPCAKS